jgi:ribonuclease J
LRVCIHRGANELGGSCVEVNHDGARLVLDAGLPLDVKNSTDEPLPPVAGLADGDSSIVGLLVSHGHPDHYGLVAKAHPAVPVFIGEATERILREAVFFTGGGARLRAAGHFADRMPFTVGPFTVTPYLVDHSAFDAYALLIEAGGKRLLYSGDLRGHGRKAALFERLLSEPPESVDVLLLEGTNIREDAAAPSLSESELEDRCVEVFRSTPGMVLACYSAQNIDRLVTLFRAAKRTKRLLVLDLYAATIARATGRETIPQTDWEGVRVFIPLSQRIKVKQAREFARFSWVHGPRLFPEQLAGCASELVMTFRASMAAELDRAGCLNGAHAIWSMWEGYLDEPSGVRLRDWLAARRIPLSAMHSSGHASVADLQRFAAAVDAKELVPMHTRHSRRYADLFANVRVHLDGEWWTV